MTMKLKEAEYSALRNEIQRRSNEQFGCITASIVSIGVIFGLVFKEGENFLPLLVLIPWILFIFGLIWIENHIKIHQIARYIKENLISGWEKYQKKDKVATFPFLFFAVPLIFFILPSFITELFIFIQIIDLTQPNFFIILLVGDIVLSIVLSTKYLIEL